MFVNPNPRFVVDGHCFDHEDSDLEEDGAFAPFYVFDTELQEHAAGPFDTRDAANEYLKKALS